MQWEMCERLVIWGIQYNYIAGLLLTQMVVVTVRWSTAFAQIVSAFITHLCVQERVITQLAILLVRVAISPIKGHRATECTSTCAVFTVFFVATYCWQGADIIASSVRMCTT
jgi:hypothetical protein